MVGRGFWVLRWSLHKCISHGQRWGSTMFNWGSSHLQHGLQTGVPKPTSKNQTPAFMSLFKTHQTSARLAWVRRMSGSYNSTNGKQIPGERNQTKQRIKSRSRQNDLKCVEGIRKGGRGWGCWWWLWWRWFSDTALNNATAKLWYIRKHNDLKWDIGSYD